MVARLSFASFVAALLLGAQVATAQIPNIPHNPTTDGYYAPPPAPTVSSVESLVDQVDSVYVDTMQPEVTYEEPEETDWLEMDSLPLWNVQAGALVMDRATQGSAVLMFNTVTPAEDLNANDLNFRWQVGFEVAATRRFGNNAVEFRYFGLDESSAATSNATTAGDLFQINAAVPVFTFSGDSIDARYFSELHSGELNGRHAVSDWLTVLGGMRYLELDERLSAQLVNSAVPFTLNTSTRNRLYGGQIGAQVQLWNSGGWFNLDGIAKAGIYSNQAASGSTFTTGVVTLPAAGAASRAAFVGELGAVGTYQVTERLSLRGSYQMLWLDGVALASDQLLVSDFALGTGFTSGSTALFHGAFGGVQYVW